MKKFLIILIILSSIFMFNSVVLADEIDSCYDDYLITDYEVRHGGSRYYSDGGWEKYIKWGVALWTYTVLFPVSPNNTYYIKFFNSVDLKIYGLSSIFYYDDNLTMIDTIDLDYSYNSDTFILSLIIPEDFTGSYISLVFRPDGGTDDTTLKNNTTIAFADFDLSSCPSTDDSVIPVLPDNPTPIETDQIKILLNFYNIFIDRLKFISNFAVNNFLFLGFIGVILCFVILEIFLYFYNFGGYK